MGNEKPNHLFTLCQPKGKVIKKPESFNFFCFGGLIIAQIKRVPSFFLCLFRSIYYNTRSMDKNCYAVVMAGGIGSRFWPFSRTHHPKQFHDVLGTGKTMLQETVDRFEGLIPRENILVVTSLEYRDLVLRDLPWIKSRRLLLEPVRRNTAPCIAYASYIISLENPEASIIVCPSDHVITKPEAFRNIVDHGLQAVKGRDILLTLGIKPHRPDTGYGYIQFHDEGQGMIKKVKTFTEKPELELARKFIESGDFVWNAGIFIWNCKAIMASFKEYLTYLWEIFEQGKSKLTGAEESTFIEQVYSQSKNISIDYAILEKAANVYVIPAEFGWSDLGTWKSLYELSDKNEDGNVVSGNVMLYQSRNNIIKTSEDRLTVVFGLDDFIVAEHDGVTMICPKQEEQRVKEFVADLKSGKNNEYI
jgi:mannose-1-phosphate guanylyltransferase